MLSRDLKIIDTRANFEFLSNGSMRITRRIFNDSVVEAVVDAVKNHGEDLDDMIKMVFTQTNTALRSILSKMIKNYK